MTLPTHDENTGKKLLVKSDLKDGSYYVGRCRNASVARWNASKEIFTHWRQKFESVFVEDIKHPEDDQVFDVFRPLRELADPKFEIPFEPANFMGDLKDLDEHNLEVWCTCKPGSALCIHHKMSLR
jgi:hypothetical protein